MKHSINIPCNLLLSVLECASTDEDNRGLNSIVLGEKHLLATNGRVAGVALLAKPWTGKEIFICTGFLDKLKPKKGRTFGVEYDDETKVVTLSYDGLSLNTTAMSDEENFRRPNLSVVYNIYKDATKTQDFHFGEEIFVKVNKICKHLDSKSFTFESFVKKNSLDRPQPFCLIEFKNIKFKNLDCDNFFFLAIGCLKGKILPSNPFKAS